jgi:hypothetical protein
LIKYCLTPADGLDWIRKAKIVRKITFLIPLLMEKNVLEFLYHLTNAFSRDAFCEINRDENVSLGLGTRVIFVHIYTYIYYVSQHVHVYIVEVHRLMERRNGLG